MILHQAIDSITGAKYQWSAATYDLLASGYPGPNQPTNLIVLAGLGAGRNAALAVPAYKTWIQAGDGSAPIGVQREYHVDQFGAVGDGNVDDYAAINACLQAAINNPYGGTIVIGPRAYRITQTLVIPRNNIHIRSEGMYTGTLIYDPATADGAAVRFAHAGTGITELAYNSIRDLRITKNTSNGIQGVGLDIWGGGNFKCTDIVIDNFNGYNGSEPSIGIRVRGHEAMAISDVRISADRAVSVELASETELNGSLDLDHTTWTNIYLQSQSATEPVFFVDGRACITNFKIMGNCPFIGGKDGFSYVSDSPQTGQAFSIDLTGIRVEQGLDLANGFAINIDRPCQNVKVDNVRSDRNTIRARQILSLILERVFHDSGHCWLDLDSCECVDVRNVFVAQGFGAIEAIGSRQVETYAAINSPFFEYPTNRTFRLAPYLPALVQDGYNGIMPRASSGTGSQPGRIVSIEGGSGQPQTGTANNNPGGNCMLIGGAPGAGGSGTAGVPGNITLAVHKPSGIKQLTTISENLGLGGAPLFQSTEVFVDVNGTQTVCPADFSGILMVELSTGVGPGTAAIFTIKGSTHSVVAIGTNSDFGVTSAAANYNVFWSSSSYVLENHSLSAIQFSVYAFGSTGNSASIYGSNGRCTFSVDSISSSTAPGTAVDWTSDEGLITINGSGYLTYDTTTWSGGKPSLFSTGGAQSNVFSLGFGAFNGTHTQYIIGVKYRTGNTIAVNRGLFMLTTNSSDAAIAAYHTTATTMDLIRASGVGGDTVVETSAVAAGTEYVQVWYLGNDNKMYTITTGGVVSAGSVDITNPIKGMVRLYLGNADPGDMYYRKVVFQKPILDPSIEAMGLFNEMVANP